MLTHKETKYSEVLGLWQFRGEEVMVGCDYQGKLPSGGLIWAVKKAQTQKSRENVMIAKESEERACPELLQQRWWIKFIYLFDKYLLSNRFV